MKLKEFKKKENLFKKQQNWCREYRNKLKANPTEPELKLFNKVKDTFNKAIFQKGFLLFNKTFTIVDIYIPRPYGIVIEVDGGYHNTPEQILKDQERDRWLTKKRNFKVIRVKNEDVDTLDIISLIENAKSN